MVKHDKKVLLTFTTLIPVVLVTVFAIGNPVLPNMSYDPYQDGTSESAIHEMVHIPYEKPEPVADDTQEDVGTVSSEYDDSYDTGYDGIDNSYDSGYESSGGGQLTYSNGVNYYNGHRETWYSSNESGGAATAVPVPGLYCDENGVYRDGDGYVVVASDDRGYGSTVETSWGTGKVYDNFGGSASGTDAVDIFTRW